MSRKAARRTRQAMLKRYEIRKQMEAKQKKDAQKHKSAPFYDAIYNSNIGWNTQELYTNTKDGQSR